jgi:hypothetical protein
MFETPFSLVFHNFPEYSYDGEFFSFYISLRHRDYTNRMELTNQYLIPSLLMHNDPNISHHDNEFLTIRSQEIVNGYLKITIKLSNVNYRNFRIKVQLYEPPPPSVLNGQKIFRAEGISQPMRCFHYLLKVDTFKSFFPGVIDVSAKLVDTSDQIVFGQVIPLEITGHAYGTWEQHNSLFRLSDPLLRINSETGEINFKLNYDELSREHPNLFTLTISPIDPLIGEFIQCRVFLQLIF